MYIFISYHTQDRRVACHIQNILAEVGIGSFLAHEDINVSEEWRIRLLEEIGNASVFISLLNNNYHNSQWCVQESGIAAFREGLTIIPLSLDGSIPQGFSSHIQSTRVDPNNITINDLIPGIVKNDFDFGITLIINIIGGSMTFRSAEENFRLILPYIGHFNDAQYLELFQSIINNNQIHHASQCANEYIPPLLKNHGHLLKPEELEFLEGICQQYA